MAYSTSETKYNNQTLTELAEAFNTAATELNNQIDAFNTALSTVSGVWEGEAQESFKGDMDNAIRILLKGKETFDKWKTAVDEMIKAYEDAEQKCNTAATQQ
ncbi:MAG: WXG100 family type VII secretion target [Lachnospiraceae bacterium]|nr:WXG100 family type VII secretion target [Lachnospiraceae bacterium]